MANGTLLVVFAFICYVMRLLKLICLCVVVWLCVVGGGGGRWVLLFRGDCNDLDTTTRRESRAGYWN